MEPETALSKVAVAVEELDIANIKRDRAVVAALDAGVSYYALAKVLGTSSQAARTLCIRIRERTT